MVKLLLLLIILILVNAFLAASEVSVVSLNKNRLRELAEDPNFACDIHHGL